MMGTSSRFDAAYFDRYYESPRTRVQGSREVARLCTGVMGMIELAGGRVESALDIGAGPGLWRDWFAREQRGVDYYSTDASAYACKHYGHRQRDITRWRARRRFDLIVCQGVLPYLRDRDAEAAIENIAAMSRGFLYLEAITKEDLETVCDVGRTDVDIHRRRGSWYRKRLGAHFHALGLGLWIHHSASSALYELERGV